MGWFKKIDTYFTWLSKKLRFIEFSEKTQKILMGTALILIGHVIGADSNFLLKGIELKIAFFLFFFARDLEQRKKLRRDLVAIWVKGQDLYIYFFRTSLLVSAAVMLVCTTSLVMLLWFQSLIGVNIEYLHIKMSLFTITGIYFSWYATSLLKVFKPVDNRIYNLIHKA